MRNRKRLLSFVLVVIILLSSTTGVFAEGLKIELGGIVENIKSLINLVAEMFKDVKSTDWYAETIARLVDRGIVNGYPDGTFRPRGAVTTAEFLKLSMEVAGIKYNNATSPWHKDLMQKALDMGIISKDLYNKPNEPIKRKDVALVLTKLIEKTPKLKAEFMTERSKEYDRFKYLIYDTTKLSQEYRDSIYKLFEYRLIIGTINSKEQVFYNPESNLTRAEVATIIERLIEPNKRLDNFAEYPNRDSIFAHENINDMTTTRFSIKPDVKNKRFLYNYDEGKGIIRDVVLGEKLNPNINRQIYELTKATIDKDKNYFLSVYPGFHGTDESKVSISVAKTELHAINNNQIWMFTMREKQPYNVKEDFYDSPNQNLSEKSVISLRLGKVWQDFAPSGWVDWFYANKLRMSFIALFGEKDGHEIYEYVLNEYVKYRLAGSNESTGYKYIYQTKNIGNIHIDYITGESATLYFDFSYIK